MINYIVSLSLLVVQRRFLCHDHMKTPTMLKDDEVMMMMMK